MERTQGGANDEQKGHETFIESLRWVSQFDQLPYLSNPDERAIAADYNYEVTEQDLKRMCETPYPGYENRLQWTPEQIAQWEQQGKPHDLITNGEWHLENHTNRVGGITKGWIKGDEAPHLVNPLTNEQYEVDSEGHPLNPHWRTLLQYGIPTGHGFYFYEGNVGNQEGKPGAVDPIPLRVVSEGGKQYLEVLVGQRSDDSGDKFAFLGGMRDKSDVEDKGVSGSVLAAIREAGEEGAADLAHSPYMKIGRFEVLDARTTLNTHVTTGVTAFFVEGDLDVHPYDGEMKKVQWVRVSPERLAAGGMFASHNELLIATLQAIETTTGIVLKKDGSLARVVANNASRE